jgi:hypothetical protein
MKWHSGIFFENTVRDLSRFESPFLKGRPNKNKDQVVINGTTGYLWIISGIGSGNDEVVILVGIL